MGSGLEFLLSLVVPVMYFACIRQGHLLATRLFEFKSYPQRALRQVGLMLVGRGPDSTKMAP